ncbi:MAG: isopentenyl phosphate kinase [Archaeoglobaceae archaeon]|nr:isopentenyl phosphate kinase [Archaeoglobaceae archaeon]MDK2875760.1 isopentenyl phosphate kinase [Archaeoglobaceae archaeon]
MRILKIGGSVITQKESFETLNESAMEEISSAIAENYRDLILVHGAGSFGHPHVKKYGLKDPISIAKIHDACMRLNEEFCRRLIKFNVPAVGLDPMTSDFLKVAELLKKGFLPVLHGDVNLKFGITSGDDLVVEFAEKFGAERIGFATNVDGVIVDGKVVKKFTREMKADVIGESDATGRMMGKIEKIFAMKQKCRVFIFRGIGENVKKFLRGEEVGTEVIT